LSRRRSRPGRPSRNAAVSRSATAQPPVRTIRRPARTTRTQEMESRAVRGTS